jgi:hypothetical protein
MDLLTSPSARAASPSLPDLSQHADSRDPGLLFVPWPRCLRSLSRPHCQAYYPHYTP